LFVGRSTLAAATEDIDLILDFGSQKPSLRHLKNPVERQLLLNLAAEWWNVDLCLQINLSFHKGRSFHANCHQIPKVSTGHCDIQADSSMIADFVFDDATARGECCTPESADHRL